MEGEARIVLVVMGIIFWVVRSILKSNKKKTNKPVAKRQKTAPTSAGKSQNIDDIFKDFVKELEKKKQTQQPTSASRKVATSKPIVTKKKEQINWQEVERTHIAPKKQLIDHEDYHGAPLKGVPSIEETEGEVYSFDIDNIDFRDAIVTKEILDKKYA